MCVYIYIYIYIHMYINLSLSLYIYIYIYTHTHLGVNRVGDGEITFQVPALQMLGTFTICYCVPVGRLCTTAAYTDFKQFVGIYDLRGADPSQTYICGRGGVCTIVVTGRGLQSSDFVKVVNMTTDCTGPEVTCMYVSLSLSISLSLYIYIYTLCICVYIYIYIYAYIYIYINE